MRQRHSGRNQAVHPLEVQHRHVELREVPAGGKHKITVPVGIVVGDLPLNLQLEVTAKSLVDLGEGHVVVAANQAHKIALR